MGLRELREKAGKTLREVADELNVSHTTVMRWEDRDRVPRKHVAKLAAVLEVDAELLSGPQNEPSEGFVQSWVDLRAWSKAVAHAKMDSDVKLLLAMLSVHLQPDTWIVPVTLGRFAAETHLSNELVERGWPKLLESPWVERVGDVEFVFRLRFVYDE